MNDVTFPLRWRIALLAPALAVFIAFWLLPMGALAQLSADGHALVYSFDTQDEDSGIAPLLQRLHDAGIVYKDLHSSESSLEDIFVSLVHEGAPAARPAVAAPAPGGAA